MHLTRVGITAVSSALTGALLVATAILVASWAALATYDTAAARVWAHVIVEELRIAPGYAEQAVSHAQIVAIAAAALALIGLGSLYEGWRATRDAASLHKPRQPERLFALLSGTLLMVMGAVLAAWATFATSEPGLAMGLASSAAKDVPLARNLAEYSMENLPTLAAFAAFLLLCGFLELRSASRPFPGPSLEPPIPSPHVEMMQAPAPAPPFAAPIALELTPVESAAAGRIPREFEDLPTPVGPAMQDTAGTVVRLDTEGVVSIEEALARIGIRGLTIRQKTALAALRPDQQESLAKLLNWSATHKKTTFVIVAFALVQLLAAIAASLFS